MTASIYPPLRVSASHSAVLSLLLDGSFSCLFSGKFSLCSLDLCLVVPVWFYHRSDDVGQAVDSYFSIPAMACWKPVFFRLGDAVCCDARRWHVFGGLVVGGNRWTGGCGPPPSAFPLAWDYLWSGRRR